MSYNEDEEVVGGFKMSDDEEELEIPEGMHEDFGEEEKEEDPDDRYH
ncbi:MAG TPA: hypothetical protein VGO21_01365 [Candidatus Paceibacterota bacterium]|jgi:hypothetical protein|nr:hypothetical protein [Candidatus Paceibacterota bacterium]